MQGQTRLIQGTLRPVNLTNQRSKSRGVSQPAGVSNQNSQQYRIRTNKLPPNGAGKYSKGYFQGAAPGSQVVNQSSQVKENNISAEVINYLKDELLATWESYLIPDYHRIVFLDCIYGLKPNQFAPIMVKEIEDLQTENSPIQNTIRAIIARESCISQIQELEKVLQETDEKSKQLLLLGMGQNTTQVEKNHAQLLDECVNILHSLRMLSLHVVRCIIEWRKQLIYNCLMTAQAQGQPVGPQRNNVKKFKNIPFLWENQNYLLKMKSDTSIMLYNSHFSLYFNFSQKNDPFLVNPSTKIQAQVQQLAQGGGVRGLKKLRGTNDKQVLLKRKKLLIPLQNQLMKIIRQSEVYLMEEAVTDQIVRSTQSMILDVDQNIQEPIYEEQQDQTNDQSTQDNMMDLRQQVQVGTNIFNGFDKKRHDQGIVDIHTQQDQNTVQNSIEVMINRQGTLCNGSEATVSIKTQHLPIVRGLAQSQIKEGTQSLKSKNQTIIKNASKSEIKDETKSAQSNINPLLKAQKQSDLRTSNSNYDANKSVVAVEGQQRISIQTDQTQAINKNQENIHPLQKAQTQDFRDSVSQEVELGITKEDQGSFNNKLTLSINTRIAVNISEIPDQLKVIESLERMDQKISEQPFDSELVGWRLNEKDYKQTVAQYLTKIDDVQRETFAPLDQLIYNSLDGLDLHVMVFVNKSHSNKYPISISNVKGLLIFNQESQLNKGANGKNQIKIIIHHLSCIDAAYKLQALTDSMEYIWQNTHSMAIRINIYHFKDSQGNLKADPEIKSLLKAKKFKWKTVINNMDSGLRYEILETINSDFQEQLRSSKATIFRKGLDKDDLFKEPLSIFFSSMIAFGNTKIQTKMKQLEKFEEGQIQSQASMVSNMMIYNYENLKKNKPDGEVQQNDMPLLSDIEQEEKHGLVADLNKAINNYEKSQQKLSTVILPKVNYEFEQSNNLQSIKAIRGFTPKADLKIQLSDTLKALLVSKCLLEARFKAVDTAHIKDPLSGSQFAYLRIRNCQIFEGHAPQFRKIYIIQSVENDLSLIICLPNHSDPSLRNSQQSLDSMHDNVKNALSSMKEQKVHSPGETSIWIPQFKIGDKKVTDEMRSEDKIKNFKVQDSVYVQEYINQSFLELYGLPLSSGNLILDEGEKRIVVEEQEFIVAVTLQQLENAGLDLPLCVAKVMKNNWKKV